MPFGIPLIPSIPGLNASSAGAEPYITKTQNWYQALPYGFSFYDISKQSQNSATTTIYLPIAPSNLSVETKLATNVVTTLYGVVEEHSATRYYDITIQGNTGIAPRYVKPIQATNVPPWQQTATQDLISSGRSTFLTSIPAALPGNNATPALGAITGLLGVGDITNPTGVKPNQTGYLAFHNLYKFFLKYKLDTSQSAPVTGAQTVTVQQSRKVHPLSFLNYKDGVKYDAIPLSFTMNRSADQPMLYFYNIKIRCFNLRSITGGAPPTLDQGEKLGLGAFELSNITEAISGALGVLSGG